MRSFLALLVVQAAGAATLARGRTPARLQDRTWSWNGYNIRYQCAGEENKGPSVLLVHGFGGNADHWRDNTAALAEAGLRCFAIDLLGYGKGDKPDPMAMAAMCGERRRGDAVTGTNKHPLGSGYNFYTWADQLLDFAQEVVADDEGVFAVCNSVGSVAALQAAKDAGPSRLRGVFALDPSLRMLHVERQNPLQRPFTSALQTILRETPVGLAFFGQVAQPETVRTVLKQAYAVKDRVDDELVAAVLSPGLSEGAARVFLDFISYSGGPLPEDLLEAIDDVPVWIGWGDQDPWEPIAQGRAYADYECVKRFIALPGVGHCPQDEVPEQVNALVREFVASICPDYAATAATVDA